MQTIIKSALAGISISLGGTVYLLIDSKTVGALFFTVGLFCVCAFGFSLFTGKVCYVFDNDRKYALSLPLIWLGNLIGSLLVGFLLLQTRLGSNLYEKAAVVCQVKLNQGCEVQAVWAEAALLRSGSHNPRSQDARWWT